MELDYSEVGKITLAGKTFNVADIVDIDWDGNDDPTGYYEADCFYVEFKDGTSYKVFRDDIDVHTELLLDQWVDPM